MRTGLTDLLKRLAARPEGFDTVDRLLGGYPTDKVGTVANRMVEQGDLFKGKVSHKVIRYFDTQVKAHAYVASKTAPKIVALSAMKTRAPAEWAGVPGVENAQTIYSYGPAYQPRFQAVDLAGIHSGLQSGRVLKQPESNS